MLSNSSTQLVKHTFSQLGLTSEHADVYLSSLKLGKATASKIAKLSKVPRSSCYDILDILLDWGFVTEVKQDNKTFFSPENPTNLLEKFDSHKNRTVDTYYQLEKNLYELEMIYAQTEPLIPKVRFYKGENGMKTALYDSLSSTELLTICGGNPKNQQGIATEPKYLTDFLEECEFREVKSREIFVETPSAIEYTQEKFEDPNTSIIIIPSSEAPPLGHVDKHLYDGKIGYISHDSVIAVIIEDKALYDNEVAQFEALWSHYSEKYGIANR